MDTAEILANYKSIYLVGLRLCLQSSTNFRKLKVFIIIQI